MTGHPAYGVVSVGDLVKLTPRGRPWLVTGFKAGPGMAYARLTPHGWTSDPATVAVDRLIVTRRAGAP